MIQMLGSVENEHVFNNLNFIKIKNQNWLIDKQIGFVSSHVWAIIFCNAQFSLWWSCGDLTIKEASISFECLQAIQLQVV